MDEAETTLYSLPSLKFAQRPALVIPGDGSATTTVTYAELRNLIAETAAAFQGAGIKRDDTVLLVLGGGLAMVASFLAVAWLGAAAAPVNPLLTEEELTRALTAGGIKQVVTAPGDHPVRTAAEAAGASIIDVDTISGSRLVVAGGRYAGGRHDELPPPATAPSPDAVALFLYTSGTTSTPKGVPLSHANLMASISGFARTFRLSEGDRTIAVMPLFHVHGLIGSTLSTLATGGVVVMPPRFSASAFWPQVEANGVTWYSAAPTIHRILLERADRDSAPRSLLRFIRSSSARLGASFAEALEARFDTVVLEAYGMTEAANQITANPLPPARRKAGSVGLPAGSEVAILAADGAELPAGSEGEVVIRGPSVMAGYRNNEEANRQAFRSGWFATGDAGRLDADGYLYISGRLKELIIRGGENISPAEIEEVLLRHPQILEAVAFGAPDEKYGETVHAAVVPGEGIREEEVLDFCRRHLAGFKVPVKIHLAEQLPKTATNKIQRALVARQFLT